MFVVTLTGPTTSGKTTLLRNLQAINDDVHELISHTTRAPRPGEIDGETYHFVSPTEFNKVDFIEKIEFNGKSYGLSAKEIMSKMKRHDIVPIVIMEPHGVSILEAWMTKNRVGHVFKIFVDVPEEVAAKRMIERIQNSKDASYSANRMVSLMKTELPQWPKANDWDLFIREYNDENKDSLPEYLSALLESMQVAFAHNLPFRIKGTIGESALDKAIRAHAAEAHIS